MKLRDKVQQVKMFGKVHIYLVLNMLFMIHRIIRRIAVFFSTKYLVIESFIQPRGKMSPVKF